MSDPDPIKQAWQAGAADAALPDLDTVRAGADRFYRQVRRRNLIEYAACVFVILCFSAYALFLPSPTARIGAAMIVLGTLIVARQLHRLASAVMPPERAAAEPILTHQRAQLARQRDALASVFTWYLLPLIPGLLVMMTARAVDHGLAAVPPAAGIGLLASIAVFAGIWLLNQRGARRLQRRIDEIDALTGERD